MTVLVKEPEVVAATPATLAERFRSIGFPPIPIEAVLAHKKQAFFAQRMSFMYRIAGMNSLSFRHQLCEAFGDMLMFLSFDLIPATAIRPGHWFTRRLSLSGYYKNDSGNVHAVPPYVRGILSRAHMIAPRAVYEISFLGTDPILAAKEGGEVVYFLIYDYSGIILPKR